MDFRHRVLACATTWRRPSPPAPSPIVDYYVSPGGAGDYAEATTGVAVDALFPSGAAGPATLAFWARDTGEIIATVYRDDGAMMARLTRDGGTNAYLTDDADGPAACVAIDEPGASWTHIAYVLTGTQINCFANGAAFDGPVAYPGGTYARAALVSFLSIATDTGSSQGDLRNIHVFTRALSGAEIAALYAAGPTHNIRTASGAWAGETALVSWDTPAVDGVVPNTGSGGACGLTLEGAVTSEVDP